MDDAYAHEMQVKNASLTLWCYNTNLGGLDVAAASTDTNPGCAISPAFAEPLEEAGTAANPPTTFMATDGVAEVGGEERAFAQWKWNGKQYELGRG